jgi:hypothetical protein
MKATLLLTGLASLALAACGRGGDTAGNETNAAPANAAAEPLVNAIEPSPPVTDNAADVSAATPAAPAPRAEPRAVEPARRALPRVAPRRPPAPAVRPKAAEPDPHAGHDMANMSHD